MTNLCCLTSEICTQEHAQSMFNPLIMFTHRDEDIEMSDNAAYGTTHHTHVTCADESQYEDVKTL